MERAHSSCPPRQLVAAAMEVSKLAGENAGLGQSFKDQETSVAGVSHALGVNGSVLSTGASPTAQGAP